MKSVPQKKGLRKVNTPGLTSGRENDLQIFANYFQNELDRVTITVGNTSQGIRYTKL